mmetsp:Transcript_10187/g.15403  ORF Transcript_10187/g.15403 Transcript_10187/m.15403 type:complete len:542 (+) Transcript_10187:35-1660(+)|eukprot:CAMPEP_0197319062 /NCGR_PEP_ID=MMETSP0891-20130614/53296_1 /TAXON_ID=44058 ORGANISM="Aureoumbra lagunensis, Strain CCMP1510" /NCGR_SAMPLE_ID=MMETSP0891 /ASSEMBLY_ACC=CAM_ASM_000534 /LENGTH=541 /DNA_ID=CAMNT_0042809801 /DNA_START=28 /DNA_END=1653 /DNA_ORIENTATION=-
MIEGELSEYEAARKVRMEENAAYLESLGLGNKRKFSSSRGGGGGCMSGIHSESLEKERAKKRNIQRERMLQGIGINELNEHWPEREVEISMLTALIGSESSCLAVIGGCSGSGKSGILRAVLEAHGEPYAWINCASLPRGAPPRTIAAAAISKATRGLLANISFMKKCKRGAEDAVGLGEACAILAEAYDDAKDLTATIVLDDAGLVLAPPWSIKKNGCWPGDDEIEAELLAAFVHARRVISTKLSLRIFFVGDDRALSGRFMQSEFLRLHFSAYNAQQIKKVLFLICKRRGLVPPGLEIQFQRFIDHIATVCRRCTSDLRDLVQIVASKPLFAFFSAQPSDHAFRSLLPILSAALERIHDPYLDIDELLANHRTTKQTKVKKILQEFTTRTKLLLLASYIATHSSRDTDKKNFSGGYNLDSQKKKNQQQQQKDTTQITSRLTPQAAQLDRILSIHAYIVSAHTLPSSSENDQRNNMPIRNPAVLQALATLSHNKLVERCGASEDLSQLRFKCLLSDDSAFELASNIRFPLANYLPAARHM